MPRRTTGLGGGGKIPLRGFTQLLKHLDPATRSRLESAFADAESMIDYHSRTVPERQNRRRFSGTIARPVVTVESTIVGAFVRWNRLDDPRITFYEVEMSDDDTFSNPEAYTSIETFFALENITTTKFVRVRGIRSNGEAGLFSVVEKIRPTITAPSTISREFYPGYEQDSYPTLGDSKRYSGGVRRLPAFYSVLDETFYADRFSGGFSVWGMMSSRLATMVDGGVVPWDRVRFKVNGLALMDGYFPHWTNMMDEDANAAANENDRDPNGDLMSFYMQGGYTASFGPYNVNIPNSLAGEGPRDPKRVINLDSSADDRGNFYWTDGNNARLPSRFDQAQFETPSTGQGGLAGASDPGAARNPQHEAHSQSITEDQRTDYLWFHDFNFDIPPERTITGIRVQISRRQPNLISQGIIDDLGSADVNRPLNDSRNYDGAEDNLNWVAWAATDIVTDVDYGDHVQPNDRFDRLRTNVDEDLVGVVNKFTLSVWVNFSHDDVADNQLLAGFGQENLVNHCRIQRGAAPNFDDDLFVRMQGATGNIRNLNYYSVVPNLDQWYHIAVTKDAANNIKLYVDGQLTGPNATSGGPLQDFTDTNRTIRVCAAGFGAGSAFKGGVGQCAIWNTVLSSGDITSIYKLRMNGDYRFAVHSENLMHYYLAFPDQGDTQDNAVYLTDRSPTNIVRVRSDLNNKAVTDESWPQLSDFFSTAVRQYSYLPLGDSDGIPHDNHNAIGYQDYGGEIDLWGGAWTPARINDFYFGFVLQAVNNPTQAADAHAYVDHGKVTVYHVPEEDRSIRAMVEVAVANQFYIEREVFGGIFNIIEMGEKEADDYVRCQAGT